MASGRIRPSPYFFFQRPEINRGGDHVGGYWPQTRVFKNSKHNSPPDLHGLNCRKYQIPHSHEIVSSSGEREHPRDGFQAAMPSLPQRANRLHPAKHFFDPLPFSLTHLVAIMPRRAAIDRAAALTLGVLRNMRSDIHTAHLP